MNKKEMLEIQEALDPYKKEQAILMRLIRRHGTLTEQKFDSIFHARKFKIKKGKAHSKSRNALILRSWNEHIWYFDLIQSMVLAGIINAKITSDGVVYTLAA